MAEESAPQFMVHREGDHVAVAVTDIEPGQVLGAVLAGDRDVTSMSLDVVPLGHKFALIDIAAGEQVIEYGVPIGVAVEHIAQGAYVHTHNLRSARWHSSVAS